MLNLTQQEYVNRIEELNQALRESWEQDQRVKALKIGIQVLYVNFLVDSISLYFYNYKINDISPINHSCFVILKIFIVSNKFIDFYFCCVYFI